MIVRNVTSSTVDLNLTKEELTGFVSSELPGNVNQFLALVLSAMESAARIDQAQAAVLTAQNALVTATNQVRDFQIVLAPEGELLP